jgi:hypothetical protein
VWLDIDDSLKSQENNSGPFSLFGLQETVDHVCVVQADLLPYVGW